MINLKFRVMLKSTRKGIPYFTHKGETWVSASYKKNNRYSKSTFISLQTGQVKTFLIV